MRIVENQLKLLKMPCKNPDFMISAQCVEIYLCVHLGECFSSDEP